MQDSNSPTKFPAMWAYGASSPYTNAIPTSSQQGIKNGAASLQDGFPPNCFIPYASGGAGPFGGDTNGILQQITAGVQWFQAGGPIAYDGTFSGNIGGYPRGAVLQSTAVFGQFWQSTVDNNTTDPDTGGSGWQLAPYNFTPVQQGGGTGQSNNKVYIGWDGSAGSLRAQVDATDIGEIAQQGWVTTNFGGKGATNGWTGANVWSGTSQLIGAVTINGTVSSTNANTWSGTNTFTVSPVIPNAAVNTAPVALGQFVANASGTQFHTIDPTGVIDVTYGTNVPIATGLTSTNVTLPVNFLTFMDQPIVQFDGVTPPAGASVSAIVGSVGAGNTVVTVTTNGTTSGSAGVVIRVRGF